MTIDGWLDSKKEDTVNHRFFEFKPKQEDYFYNYKMSWDVITAKVYHLEIGNRVFGIPSTFYVMIGDSYGEVDWIKVDELIGRQIECVSMDAKLESWNLFRPTLVDVSEETFQWPLTSNIIPSISTDRVILVSNKDQHFNTKNFLIDSFVLSV